MMPVPDSPTSGTPSAPAEPDLLYASAVRLLAAHRIAFLEHLPSPAPNIPALAWRYGVTLGETIRMGSCTLAQAKRAMVTGQVPE